MSVGDTPTMSRTGSEPLPRLISVNVVIAESLESSASSATNFLAISSFSLSY